eukprot:CAMPEP_0171734940 /NCGR_PEP_ID=MMETSP0991-20121206/31265_1 /TAXON_ID=483369 /ORGANISM="non described non described, Strain CCMP2098" /LENGTH=78 /DNA_ID=CAMNT_0012331119 /DNA_START=143 /DNA_END=375 /DNA_ORIENTATION=+
MKGERRLVGGAVIVISTLAVINPPYDTSASQEETPSVIGYFGNFRATIPHQKRTDLLRKNGSSSAASVPSTSDNSDVT